MSLLKDYKDHHLTMIKRYWWKELINPKNLYYTAKHRQQRAERGWSDRDTWNTGDYILEVVSGMLKKLGDEKSHIDWDEYFATNYKTHGYKSLAEVAADIDEYINFDEVGWVDNLGFELKTSWRDADDGNQELTDLNTPKERRLITKAIKDSHKEEKRLQAKMKKAMTFVVDNIPGLWD